MIRLRKGETNALSPLVEKLFKPMGEKMLAVAEEGIRSGELISVEPSQVMYAVFGPNVFYFLSAPMMRVIAEADSFHPSALEFRRKVSVEFLGQAIFLDRVHGAHVAALILADTPMPQPATPGQRASDEPRVHTAAASETQSRKLEPVQVRYK